MASKVNLRNAKQFPIILKNGLNSRKSELGNKLVDLIKATISIGQSPVREVGRFIGYKNPSRYPASLKSRSPVNLRLTGRMLNSLKSKVVKGSIQVGIWNNKEAKKLAKLEAGEFPLAGPRPVLPSKKGQKFNIGIERQIISWFNELVKNALKTMR